MISSAMLPNVALRMPPTCGPGERPEPLRREADDPGEAEDRDRRDDEDERLVGVDEPRRGRSPRALDDDGPEDDHPAGRAGSRTPMRPAGWTGRVGLSPWARILAGGRRRDRAAAAGGRSRPRRAGRPRPGPARRSRAPRRAARAVASSEARAASAAAAPPGPVAPVDQPTTTATSPRAGIVPSSTAAPSQVAERSADDLLVELRQLAADGRRPVRAAGGGEVGERGRAAAPAPRR